MKFCGGIMWGGGPPGKGPLGGPPCIPGWGAIMPGGPWGPPWGPL